MEYDAFGVEMSLDSVLTQPSTSNSQLPFRFSTKNTDSETALSYYGYRYYSADMGRWTARDPIEEKGGVNLFAMVANDSVGRIDLLGLQRGGCNKCRNRPANPTGPGGPNGTPPRLPDARLPADGSRRLEEGGEGSPFWDFMGDLAEAVLGKG